MKYGTALCGGCSQAYSATIGEAMQSKVPPPDINEWLIYRKRAPLEPL